MMQLPHALIPSKTFLFGEYAVLAGAPAVLLATPPFFEVVSDEFETFHKSSIANKMLTEQQKLGIRGHKIKGLGRSSAEAIIADANKDIDMKLNSYKRACDDLRCIASGADLICQWFGECTVISNKQNVSEKWLFDDIDIGIWSTGKSLATQSHLLDVRKIPDKIIESANSCYHAWQGKDIESICANVKEFQQNLVDVGLQSNETTMLVEKISAFTGIILAKGCGAMGADIILTLSKKQDRNYITEIGKYIAIEQVFLNNFVVAGFSSQITQFHQSTNLGNND